MRKLFISLLLAMSLAAPAILCRAAPANAGITPTVGLEAALNSKYVWRGIVVVDDWVVQPSLTAGVGGFSFNVWADYMLTGQNNRKNEFDEVDLTAAYTFELGKFTLPLGVARYIFPRNADADTTEIFAGVSYDWIVTPSLVVYWDVDEAHGVYLLGSLDYSLDLPRISDKITWALGAGAGFGYASSDHNEFYYNGTDKSGFTDYNAHLSLAFNLFGYFSVTPQVVFTGLVDSDIKDNMKPLQDENNIYGGVVLSASF